MAYKIHYGSVKPTRSSVLVRKILMTICFFALFVCCARYFAAEELRAIWQTLIPSEQVDSLLQGLREGEDFAQAVAAFCEDMLHGS